MRSGLVFVTIFVLPTVRSATLDFASLWIRDTLFSPLDQTESVFDTDIPWTEASAFDPLVEIPAPIWDELASPLDQTASLFDPEVDITNAIISDDLASSSDLIPWFSDPVNLPGDSEPDLTDPSFSPLMDNPLEIADCSASQEFPVISKKNRVRRQSGAQFCPSPATSEMEELHPPDLLMETFKKNRPAWAPVMRALKDRWQNPFCYLYTAGQLPYGVCASSSHEYEWVLTINDMHFLADMVFPCTIAPPNAVSCPQKRSIDEFVGNVNLWKEFEMLYCCQEVEVIANVLHGFACVLLATLVRNLGIQPPGFQPKVEIRYKDYGMDDPLE